MVGWNIGTIVIRSCLIRYGMKVIVSAIVDLVPSGCSTSDIIQNYPYLEPEDITIALSYVAGGSTNGKSL